MENNDRIDKHENKDKPQKKEKNTALKITVAVMSLIIIALAVGLVVTIGAPSNEERLTDANYNKSYYDLVAGTNDLSVKLNKLAASNHAAQQKQLLYEIWKNAELASMSLSSLNSKDAAVNNLKKFMNQLGDYCHYLAEETNKEPLQAKQEKTLKDLGDILREVNKSLSRVQGDIENGSLEISKSEELTKAIDGIFTKFNDSSVEYPQLIYDGPFSDSLDEMDIKGLKGENIDESKGKKLVKKILSKEKIKDLTFDGECNTDIKSLCYTATLDNNDKVTIQLAKKGGSLLLISRNKRFSKPNLSDEKCVEIAEQFAKENGFESMSSVWVSNIAGVYYVNLAPVQNNAILYPDLVKVKVSSDDGAVVGFDAKNYALNHIERKIKSPSISLSEAKSKIKKSLKSNEGRLALIPFRSTQELLTYEFACQSEDELFFIYIDAATGDEANILVVIDSENGKLLM